MKWSLLYGVILCNARAIEFGAVSVVSGHIRGVTNTVPLRRGPLRRVRVPGLLRGGASLLVLGLVTLVAKKALEWRQCARRGRGRKRSMSIEVRGVHKAFDGNAVLRDVSLEIPEASSSRCSVRPAA